MPFICCDSTIYGCNNNLVHKNVVMGMQRYDTARILPFLDNGSRSKVRMFYAQVSLACS